MLSHQVRSKIVRVGVLAVILCALALFTASCARGAQEAPADLEAAILNALRSTPYSQGGNESIWSWAIVWAGGTLGDESNASWRIESQDATRVVWTVTALYPSTTLTASGKQSGFQEGPRFFVDLEDWVAELDLSSPGSQIMWESMQLVGLYVNRWNLRGTPPPIP